MPRLGLLHARDLPQAASLEGLRAQLSGDAREDLRFVHAPAGEVAQTPQGLIPGVNLFGPGQSPAMTASPGGLAPVREATSVLLHDALFVAHSMTVVDRHNRLFRDGLDNLADPALLAGWGEPWGRDAEGALCLADGYRGRAQHSDCIALPICGIGLPNYGHFLFDGLPLVLLHAHVFADLPWRVVGQSLRPWQSEILDALGLGHRYVDAGPLTVFRRVLTSTLLSMHVSHPSRFIRPLFDLLRFRFGAPPPGSPRRVFLSRTGHDGTRRLRNREAVEAAARALGFAVINPDQLGFAAQAAVMGAARVVVGESGAGLANIGFCPPGALVLELQPECLPDFWTRGMCFHLAHRWHLYLARVDAPPEMAGQPCSYEIDPLDLMTTVARIEAAA